MIRPELLFRSVVASIILTSSAGAEVIINEVLANEPGSQTTLEWIELYNHSSNPAPLGEYRLTVDGTPYDLPGSDTLAAEEYYIVCRRLYSGGSSAAFESHWGDDSGVWGDTQSEDSLARPCEISFSLINSGGSVELSRGGLAVSLFAWTEAGLDGYSWERTNPVQSAVVQSVAIDGSTPGRVNSLTPVGTDLALETVRVSCENGSTIIAFTIANRGTNPVSGSEVNLIYTGSPTGPPMYPLGDTLGTLSVKALEPSESAEVVGQFTFNGMYCLFTAVLPADDRPENNSLIFVGVGQQFPPLVLSELMANPDDQLNTEWLELRNRSDEAINVEEWSFGDALQTHPLSPGTRFIEPGEYVVVTESAVDFILFYSGFAQQVWAPINWPTFNNDGDAVRLIDQFGIEVDRFEYTFTHDNNFTWARGEEVGNEHLWGRSEDAYGTPGGFNNVVFADGASEITVTIDNVYLSPDGDGIDDWTTIDIITPMASDYSVKVYDRQGRVVKTFFDNEVFPPRTIVWDGKSDAGRRLPIGIYILLVEAGGIDSEKVPIVIAR